MHHDSSKVIGDSAQGLVTKAPSSSSWMAWVPNLISLNQDGNAYQPYGPAGIPYSLGGGSSVRWSPMGQDGNQALAYLDSTGPAGGKELSNNEPVIRFGQMFLVAVKK